MLPPQKISCQAVGSGGGVGGRVRKPAWSENADRGRGRRCANQRISEEGVSRAAGTGVLLRNCGAPSSGGAVSARADAVAEGQNASDTCAACRVCVLHAVCLCLC